MCPRWLAKEPRAFVYVLRKWYSYDDRGHRNCVLMLCVCVCLRCREFDVAQPVPRAANAGEGIG